MARNQQIWKPVRGKERPRNKQHSVLNAMTPGAASPTINPNNHRSITVGYLEEIDLVGRRSPDSLKAA